MDTVLDDVGSFPLPADVTREAFNRAYCLAREAVIKGHSLEGDEFVRTCFCRVVKGSLRKKCKTGLDVVNYPQHNDMHDQFAQPIEEAMEEGSYLVDDRTAVMPELSVISEDAKRLSEEFGRKIRLRVCITGPLELYLKKVGTVGYRDVLLMFAETVRRFARNSILNSKYVETEVISLDEPSFGFQEPSADRDTLMDVFEKAFDFGGVTTQIHLHSPSRIADLLRVRNLNVLSFELAASPKNIDAVSKKTLDDADKQLRVGVARTDIDSIVAELHDRGIAEPKMEQLVESEESIRKRFAKAKEKYGDRMAFAGPDCGLGGWPSQDAAALLLKRTVDAVKAAEGRTA